MLRAYLSISRQILKDFASCLRLESLERKPKCRQLSKYARFVLKQHASFTKFAVVDPRQFLKRMDHDELFLEVSLFLTTLLFGAFNVPPIQVLNRCYVVNAALRHLLS